MNNITVKPNTANALLLKIRNYVNIKTLRNIYYVIFDSHLTYSCIVWAQSINTVNRLIILQKKALHITNFKDQLFHASPLISENNILKFIDKITLKNILFVNKSINRQVPPLLWLVYIFRRSTQIRNLLVCNWPSRHTNFLDSKILSFLYKS